MRCFQSLALAGVVVLVLLVVPGQGGELDERATLIKNVYRRRGASLKHQKSPKDQPTEKLKSKEKDSVEYVRSIRQSGHYFNSPAIRLLMARRQQWSGEPQTDSSETVIVKSLPLPPSHFYTGGREPKARTARDPQIHNFLLEEHEDAEIQRGTFLESPRSAALIAPVQNILPEPVPAVPSLPVGRQSQSIAGPGRQPGQGPFLRAVPAVPDLPTISSFTTSPPRKASSSTNRLGPHSVSTSARSLSRSSFTRPPFRNPSPTQRARQKISSQPVTEKLSISVTTSRARQPILPQTETSFRSPSRGNGHETTLTETTRSRTSPFPDSTQSSRTTIRVTTRRPVLTVSHILETTSSTERVHHPELGLLNSDDPCHEGNHQIIAGQPERSFNHHLSVGNGPPVCDRDLLLGWYRFESPAGNLLPTECPGGNYCGTQIPVWMKGTVPSVHQGIMATTACINQDRECCIGELDIAVRNCSSFVAYRLMPTPGCNMGYCVGEGVPCPEGLASSNGYTPCDFTVKMEKVVLTQGSNTLQSEIIFHCNPVLKDVIVPESIEIDIKWYVDEENVLSETFNAKDKVSGTLTEEHWRMGQTIHCEAQAKHNIVGARTERKKSQKQFAGLVVTTGQEPLEVVEGGPPSLVSITSTIPVLCSPQDRAFGECCIHLELAMNEIDEKQHCPQGNPIDRAGLPNCLHKICRHDWNSTHYVPIKAVEDFLFNGEQLLALDIRTGFTSTKQWRNYVLPVQEVRVIPGTITEQCQSDNSMFTFDSLRYSHKQQGSYVLYRHKTEPYEVQVYYRRCNLRELCHCAVAVRVSDLIVLFDICSRGYLQVWGIGKNGQIIAKEDLPEGIKLLSLDEGRSYQIYFPSGTYISLGPYLSYIKIFASKSDFRGTEGLCGTYDHNQANEFTSPDGSVLCKNEPYSECLEFSKSWMLAPEKTLFQGQLLPQQRNSTASEVIVTEKICACKHTEESAEKISRLNEITTNRFFQAGSLDLKGQLTCSSRACRDRRAVSVLEDILESSNQDDLEKFSASSLDLDTAENQVATVKVVGGPVLPRPQDGWTITTADTFCKDFIQSNEVVPRCRDLPGVDVKMSLENCRNDVLYAGDTRYAMLHLDRIKEDCRNMVTRNTTLWARDPLHAFPLPPQEIVDFLCLNDCSGHGQCSKGVCLCADGWLGSDCSVDILAGPRIANLGNNGLCDVRSKPCRNLVVSGDNFADHPDLVCHFEIFKIRGVASKQLVQDLDLTTPATFISFQQVSCSLPTLDIHSNKERHRFDLRDNTDQTRMFVKVSVGYGEGNKSAPLDLLLYDSQCWHCSLTGECNAKPNNKCVFSAATSSVQTFRIGKSISSGDTDFNVCSLPHDSGGCERKEFRYFYNALERRCKLFVYGGCKGNRNNFLSEIDCVRRCGDEAAIAALPDLNPQPQLQEIDQCSQVKDEGICPGNVPRIYFDQAAKRCLLFSYGGCGGNTNNFLTEDSCIATCGGPTGALIHAIQLHGGLKPRRPICNLPIHRGGCKAKLRRFYFDSSDETCKLFVFGGCQGNENNFETMEECVINCGGPSDHSTTSFSFATATTRTTPFSDQSSTKFSDRTLRLTTEPSQSINKNLSSNVLSTKKPSEIAFTSITLPSISPCGLPKQVGSCNSFRDRYYFDMANQMCKKFRFSGCGGNGNNFMTGVNCQKNCGGAIEDLAHPKKHITERLVIPTQKPATVTSPAASNNKTSAQFSLSSTATDITGLRKRKMKRVRILPKERGRSIDTDGLRSRGNKVNQHLQVRTLHTESNDANDASDVGDVVARAKSRAILNRARLRSRMSSSSSVVSSSTEQSISLDDLDIRGSFRRPSRTISNMTAFDLQLLGGRGDYEKVKGPRVDLFHPHEKGRTILKLENSYKNASKTGEPESKQFASKSTGRVDEVMKAPPHMKGGLVIIRSYCRYPPEELRRKSYCKDSQEFYFYNVSSATCEALRGGICTNSKNKFASLDSCLRSCIVNSQEPQGDE